VPTTTLVDVSFRCGSDKRLDVRAAIEAIAQGPPSVSSNGGRTEHEGRVRIAAGTADEATTVLRAALDDAATVAGTTCEVRIFSAHPVTRI
jgi:hypothetical protein